MAKQVDVILANLEDAIPADAKEAARAGAIEMGKSFDFAKAGVGYWSRINALNSPWHLDDVTELVAQCRQPTRRHHGPESGGSVGHPLHGSAACAP
jgi:citrate lyase beta subunit